MTPTNPDKADWQAVGASFRSLGRQLKDRAVDAGGAISAANEQAAGGVVDQVSAAFTTAIGKLDETTTDPEIGRATREATARLLDAIKAELTGGDPGYSDTPGPGAIPRD
jgi:hypothetical protein